MIVRLFLALPLPSDLQKRLQDLQGELASADWQIRWTEPQNLHLTLHFLGETPENLIEDLHHDLGALLSKVRPFDLSVGGIGAFPHIEDPRIVWAGVHGHGAALEELFETSYKILKAYRIFELRKEFTPHLTLGRVEKLNPAWNPCRLQALLPQWENLGKMPVEELRLMQSHRNQEGSRYEILKQFKFKGS